MGTVPWHWTAAEAAKAVNPKVLPSVRMASVAKSKHKPKQNR